ncbi:MAG: sigma-70 family RNA polymerase sigma factor [Prevotellaceae bacterium]|nr:sigma-70 family RNA polymerase sigma factor [Prevotellaceae bacterium]
MKILEEMTDEQLAMLYVEGNDQAFDVLLQRHQDKIYAYILFVVHNRQMTEDLFQETFEHIIVNLRQRRYQPTGTFSGWCLRVAHNVVMDWYRKMKASRIVEQDDDNDLSQLAGNSEHNREHELVKEQVLMDVKRMMALLPPSQREVVYMRFYQEMSFKEIADATNVSINTSLGRMRYAILNLRRMAKKNGITLEL